MQKTNIFDVGVANVTMRTAVEAFRAWAQSGQSGYVCACDVHSLMRSRTDAEHKQALQGAMMVVPDGQPLAWICKLSGASDVERVPGCDFMLGVVAKVPEAAHYFLGGGPGVARLLAEKIKSEFPSARIVGTDEPPFRALSAEEETAQKDRIRASGATVVWVGLGCPKQEKWMALNSPALNGVLCVGVGAAFDFATGRVERAPPWMQRHALEWLHRLLSEPKRLWRRYLITAPHFLVLGGMQASRMAVRRLITGAQAKGHS